MKRTKWEEQVRWLQLAGKTNREIASELGIMVTALKDRLRRCRRADGGAR